MMHVITAEKLHDADYVSRHTVGFDSLCERVRDFTPGHAAELTGIPAEDIVGLAREYATTRPAVIRLNYGPQRTERGAMAIRTVGLLPALTGSWKDVGGGLQLSTSQTFQLNRPGLERPDLQQRSLGREARILNMSVLGQVLTETAGPPVKAIVVYNSNPAAIAPNQAAVRRGFSRPDLFTVVLEQLQTDTADYADILLPVTTFLEHTDLYLAYGHLHLQLARPAVAPPGETKSNVEIFRLLAQRMGFDDPCFRDTDEDMIRTLLSSEHPFVKGITIEELDREHSIRLRVAPNGDPFQPFAHGNFGTPSGKCEFHAETLDYTPPVESRFGDPALRARYPLEMISPKNDDSMNSTFGNRMTTDLQTTTLHVHARDAAPRGIATGDQVRVFNDRGAPSVRWAKKAPDHRNANFLTSDRLTDLGGGPTLYSCLVEMEKIGD
jgi:anaerobic selenocysteine-containing dehydrogenase